MKQNKKKGFTIVELVIVIAVIAILAAVLIPTFTNLVNKANQSVDQQFVDQLNTIVAAESAIDQPESVGDVIGFISANGIKTYEAHYADNTYYWDPAENKIFIWDTKQNKVTYPTTYKNYDTAALPEGAVQLANSKDAFENGGDIALVEDVVVTDESLAAANVITKDANVDFGDKVIKLDISNATSNTGNWKGLDIPEGKVVLNGKNGGIETAANAELYAVVVGTKSGSAAEVTINGGKYIGGSTAVQVSKGTLTINGGFFKSLTNSKFLINCIDNNYKEGTAKIIVKGGTFVNFNPADNAAEGADTNYVAEGYKVVSENKENGDIWYTVVAE